MSMSMWEEAENEFGKKYQSLSILTQLKDLEEFKNDKEVKSITDLKRLKHNMEQLILTHPKMIEMSKELNSFIEDYKERKLSGGRKFRVKEEIEKTLNSMYLEFKNTSGCDIKKSEYSKYNFASKRINPTKQIIRTNEDGKGKPKIIPLGEWLLSGFNNSIGLSDSKITKDFEKAIIDKGVKDSLIRKVKGRLFNIQREVNSGEGERSIYSEERQDNKLFGFEYKEAYKELKEIEKELGKYIDKNKAKAFIKSIKEGAKNAFHSEHKDYAKDTKINELEKENLELKKELEKIITPKEEPKSILIKVDKTPKKQEETPKEEDTPIKQITSLKTPSEPQETPINESVVDKIKRRRETSNTQTLVSDLKANLAAIKEKEKNEKEQEKLRKEKQIKLVNDLKEQLKEQKEKDRLDKIKEKKEKQKETKKDTPKEEDGYIGDDGFYHRGKKKK